MRVKKLIAALDAKGYKITLSSAEVDKYDVVQVTCLRGHIFSNFAHVLREGANCSECKRIPYWTRDVVMINWSDKFDVGEMDSNPATGQIRSVTLTCKKCLYTSVRLLTSTRCKEFRCKLCRAPSGEKLIYRVLNDWRCSLGRFGIRLDVIHDFVIDGHDDELRRKRFDFALIVMVGDLCSKWVVEFDGEQHFECVDHMGGADGLIVRQESDRIKMRGAVNEGYKVIRIDYTKKKYIEQHLCDAIIGGSMIYLSTPSIYEYLGL